jgi:hypothetical protein
MLGGRSSISDEPTRLLELGRGRAIVIAGTPEKSAVLTRLKDAIEFGRRQG